MRLWWKAERNGSTALAYRPRARLFRSVHAGGVKAEAGRRLERHGLDVERAIRTVVRDRERARLTGERANRARAHYGQALRRNHRGFVASKAPPLL